MDKEQQIIEIKECIDAVYGADCAYYDVDGFAIANEIYNKGYHKQIEGEWETLKKTNFDSLNMYSHICSVCNCFYTDIRPYGHKFCHNCGSKMKGETE